MSASNYIKENNPQWLSAFLQLVASLQYKQGQQDESHLCLHLSSGHHKRQTVDFSGGVAYIYIYM